MDPLERPTKPFWAHAPSNATHWGAAPYLAAWYALNDNGIWVCLADFGKNLSDQTIQTSDNTYQATRQSEEGMIPRPTSGQSTENDIDNW